jgi:hypothetical protein
LRQAPHEELAKVISDALRSEVGNSHRSVKTVMAWTGVSERTAQNWLSGVVGPSGEHLVQLMAHSDAVLSAVLEMANRGGLLPAGRLQSLRDQLEHGIRMIDALRDDVVVHVPLAVLRRRDLR